jgi:hypothetical protein
MQLSFIGVNENRKPSLCAKNALKNSPQEEECQDENLPMLRQTLLHFA